MTMSPRDIRQAIERNELSEQVCCLGAVSDAELVRIYALCDVLVLPVLDLDSDVEGFGMVALEAAAAGKPVIATRCGGIPDAVEDGESGILVEPGNYACLSEAIVSLLKNPRSPQRWDNPAANAPCKSLPGTRWCHATKRRSAA